MDSNLSSTNQEFEALVKPVYRHAVETESRVLLNDFYDSYIRIRKNFKARSVVGGFYMKLLSDKLQMNNLTQTSLSKNN